MILERVCKVVLGNECMKWNFNTKVSLCDIIPDRKSILILNPC